MHKRVQQTSFRRPVPLLSFPFVWEFVTLTFVVEQLLCMIQKKETEEESTSKICFLNDAPPYTTRNTGSYWYHSGATTKHGLIVPHGKARHRICRLYTQSQLYRLYCDIQRLSVAHSRVRNYQIDFLPRRGNLIAARLKSRQVISSTCAQSYNCANPAVVREQGRRRK